MISGKVSPDREATIDIDVSGPSQQPQRTEVVIDTGFNGYLTLPKKRIHDLRLPFVGNRRATLGDGNVVVLDVYLATVSWHGHEREVLALQSDGGPLIGMSLLAGSRVTLDVADGGAVRIDELPGTRRVS